MDIAIRSAAKKDLDEITMLIKLSAYVLQKNEYDLHTIAQGLELVTDIGILIENESLFVAEYNDRIVGCGGFSIKHEDKNRAELKSYFILPEHARKGISTQLLEHSVIKCKEAGVLFLNLSATLTGVSFYKKNGFSVTREFDQTLSNGDIFCMVEMDRAIFP